MFIRLIESFKNVLKSLSNILFAFLAVVLLLSLIRNVLGINKVNEKIKEEEVRVEKLRNENAELKEKLSRVQGEEYIEKQLRDKLGLAKEGEIVIVLPDEETLRKFAPREIEEEEALPDPNWKRWVKLFL